MPTFLRKTGKRGWRFLNSFSAPLRSLPDFIVIGTMKGGTTSLYGYLRDHPHVRPPVRKEVHFFDAHYHRGESWYRSFFPTSAFLRVRGRALGRESLLTGEATPAYLACPDAPARAGSLVSHARLIAVLRDPVARAWSHYHHQVRTRKDDRPFDVALGSELDAVERGEELPWMSYVRRGLYADQLELWERYFPREQILVLRSEDLFRDPTTVYDEVLRFLGLPHWKPVRFENVNPHGGYRDIPAQLEERLRVFYRPSNERLYQRLGRDLEWQG